MNRFNLNVEKNLFFQENFSNTVCKAHGASAYSNDLYYYLKFNNGDMKGRGTHHDICNSINSLLLAWMPYHLVEQFYAQELDPKEVNKCRPFIMIMQRT